MKIVWDERNADIGYYDMWIETDAGEMLQDSKIWLHDYTCDFQQNDEYRDERKKEIEFEWCWYHGWPNSEYYTHEESLTLEQAKRRAEICVVQRYIKCYEGCLESMKRLKPIAEWAEKEIAKENTK